MSTSAHFKAKLIFSALLCVGGLIAGLWYLWSSGQYTTYRIETHDPVSGLIAGAPVELHGVEVGTVTMIELTDPRTVSILLSIAKDAPVSKATVATITARGLAARGFTGYVYVALESPGAESGPLTIQPGQRYSVIPTAPSQIDTMDTAVADATQKVQTLTRLLQAVLNETTIASLKRSAGELDEIMATLTANNDRLNSLIVNAERDSRDLRPLLESVLDKKTIAALKQSIDGLREIMTTLAANNERLGSLMVNAERDSRDLRPLLTGSNIMLRELRTEMLPQFYRTIGDLDGLTRSLNGLATRIARDPSTVVRGTAMPPGPGEQ